LTRLGLADAFGKTDVPQLILNVVHPLVPEQITDFIADKTSVLVVEEGNPAYIENQVRAFAQEKGVKCAVHGKDVLPIAGEYVLPVVRKGVAAYLELAASPAKRETVRMHSEAIGKAAIDAIQVAVPVPTRPPGFCTGCPERPFFTALKLLMRERGPIHVSSDIGCNTFATLPPFNMGNTVLGYGMSLASGGAVAGPLNQPVVAVMGDGGFWHNGLTTGVVNAQWNGYDAVLVILDNGYASATGQQHIPSTGTTPWGQASDVSIERTLRGIGVKWLRHVDSYAVEDTLDVLREAMDARGEGLRVIIADNECMLAKKRRGRNHKRDAEKARRPMRRSRFGVDEAICTGDHSCIRLSGCPSLTVQHSSDPLKDGPTAHVDGDCVACALCGEAAQAAKLCPSFYKAKGRINPGRWERMKSGFVNAIMARLGAS
ncbi:MAG: thiamine pyrophosphate-dependent enzyme, partial [Rhodospirillales bacterium]|nr:thiamine pyrophosphate-dependent enzyme [Rhodospirillales bacterium]